MQLTSPVFKNNGFIPSKYTCDGENISPPLSVAGIPSKTKSLALIVDDPDSPSGTWTHWLIWNINANITEIPENFFSSDSIEGTTSWGKPGYSGPCPHSGTHRYFFKIFALDSKLNIPSSSLVSDFLEASQNHIIDQDQIIGRYSKNIN